MGEVLKLSAPWYLFYRQINALFGEDPDVLVQYEEDENIVTLRVNGQEKAYAIAEILPTEKAFGNVVMKINVVPANKPKTKLGIYKKAFEGNPVFSYALAVDTGMTSNTFNFVVLKHKICQFFNDNLGDPHGNYTALYEDVARDVFENPDQILFCTDVPENPGVTQYEKDIVIPTFLNRHKD